MNPRILVVDDEPQIRRFLRATLEVHGYEVSLAETGRAALEQVITWHPDLLLLDLGLPEIDGLEVCRRVREWSDVPIIVLSVRDREDDKVAALNLGADDYLAKPFGTNELLARIQVALRHAARVLTPQEPVITVGELRLELAAHRVIFRDQEVHLTPTEYEILKTLAIHGGKVLTHAVLMHKVWGHDQQQDPGKLRVFINQLRRKIEDDPAQPRYIVTEPGVGYRFRGDGE
jgi:two-component system, OmpR family, KDP operon response regulator KdpE